jgi:hypothetical protein
MAAFATGAPARHGDALAVGIQGFDGYPARRVEVAFHAKRAESDPAPDYWGRAGPR